MISRFSPRRYCIFTLIALVLLSGSGCTLSRTGTSTGLSYWPPGSPERELPPELAPKAKKSSP